MHAIECTWNISLNSNRVQVVGKATVPNSYLSKTVESMLISEAVKFIKTAQNTAECIILSEEPKNVVLSNNKCIAVSFAVMFKEPEKAMEYAKTISKKQ